MSAPLSRRAALAGALAAVPALAGAARSASPPMASTADPIFAAIERHKAACDDFTAASGRTDPVAARRAGRVVTSADEAALEAAWERESEALEGLGAALPVTVAGARALIMHIIAYDSPEVSQNMLAALLDAPVLMARGAA
jgi:hypothetical protein